MEDKERIEVDRCTDVYNLIKLLVTHDRQDLFLILKELCDNDTPSIKKSFEVGTSLFRKEGEKTILDWMKPIRDQIQGTNDEV